MSQVMIGIMAKRDADGNFLPEVPIYRDLPDRPEVTDERGRYDFDAVEEMLADKFRDILRAKWKEKWELEKKKRKERVHNG